MSTRDSLGHHLKDVSWKVYWCSWFTVVRFGGERKKPKVYWDYIDRVNKNHRIFDHKHHHITIANILIFASLLAAGPKLSSLVRVCEVAWVHRLRSPLLRQKLLQLMESGQLDAMPPSIPEGEIDIWREEIDLREKPRSTAYIAGKLAGDTSGESVNHCLRGLRLIKGITLSRVGSTLLQHCVGLKFGTMF